MVVADFVSNNAIFDFFYILFNGISEVPLFSSPITGILILAGVFLASRSAGIMMVISGLIGAGVAILLGAPYGLVAFGLFGYNSILTGMAFWSGPFVKSNKATFFISIFGAAVTAVVWMAMAHLMGDIFILNGLQESWAIPGFTSSFIFTTWVFMYATKRFGHDIWPEPMPPETEELIKGSLKGVSQVTFVENWKTGIFWVVGLTLAFELAPIITGQGRPWWTNAYTAQWNEFSPLYLGGLMALIGSALGVAMAILTKLPTAETRAGLHGFNQVLVMIALTSFIPLTPQAFMIAVLATLSCSFVMPAFQRFFGTWGLPALTGPL